MAKVEFESTPKSAYEVAVVTGGGTMSDVQRAALLDEFINDNGLAIVETTFNGEVPAHRYGRYKASTDTTAPASALAPLGTSTDAAKLKAENAEKDQLIARLRAQLDERNNKAEAKNDDASETVSIGGASIGTTEEAREALSQTEGVDLVGGSEEVREDMSTADRSDDNPKVDTPRRGRPPKNA